MNSVQENKERIYEIRARLARKGLTARKWSIAHGFGYTLVHQVIDGTAGKLESPKTISWSIQQALKAEGFWPEDEL